MLTPEQTASLADQILNQRQYRGLGIPLETVEDLIGREANAEQNERTILKNVRRKMHHLVADYLGDVDYEQAEKWLEEAYTIPDKELIKETCARILGCHASTRERLAHLENFYQILFAACGKPESILDLACGLNPLAFPWMNLPESTRYYAFDIHRPRIDLINLLFKNLGMNALSRCQDILVHPPDEEADVALFFKEAHRFEQRQRGCNLAMWQALRVRWLLVSLPASSLSRKFDLAERQRALVYAILKDQPWRVEEILVENELVFYIDKGTGI